MVGAIVGLEGCGRSHSGVVVAIVGLEGCGRGYCGVGRVW